MPKRKIHTKVVVETHSVDEVKKKTENRSSDNNSIVVPSNEEMSITKILLNQIALIKQESEKNPHKLAELTHALCEASAALYKWWC